MTVGGELRYRIATEVLFGDEGLVPDATLGHARTRTAAIAQAKRLARQVAGVTVWDDAWRRPRVIWEDDPAWAAQLAREAAERRAIYAAERAAELELQDAARKEWARRAEWERLNPPLDLPNPPPIFGPLRLDWDARTPEGDVYCIRHLSTGLPMEYRGPFEDARRIAEGIMRFAWAAAALEQATTVADLRALDATTCRIIAGVIERRG